MYALLSGLWRYFFSKPQVQLLVVGLDFAGKTTLMESVKRQFSSGTTTPLPKVPPTVGLNVGRFETRAARVVLWDLGGQASLRVIWDKYFSEAHGVVFVVDAADEKRVEDARTELDKLLLHPEIADAPVLVFANKRDQRSALSDGELVKRLNWKSGPERQVRCAGGSALSGEGVVDAFSWLLDEVARAPRTTRLRGAS